MRKTKSAILEAVRETAKGLQQPVPVGTAWNSDRFELDQINIAGAAVTLAHAMRRGFNRYIECRRSTLSEGNRHANNPDPLRRFGQRITGGAICNISGERSLRCTLGIAECEGSFAAEGCLLYTSPS